MIRHLRDNVLAVYLADKRESAGDEHHRSLHAQEGRREIKGELAGMVHPASAATRPKSAIAITHG